MCSLNTGENFVIKISEIPSRGDWSSPGLLKNGFAIAALSDVTPCLTEPRSWGPWARCSCQLAFCEGLIPVQREPTMRFFWWCHALVLSLGRTTDALWKLGLYRMKQRVAKRQRVTAECCLENWFYTRLLILELKAVGTSVGFLSLFCFGLCVPQPVLFVFVEWSCCVRKTMETRVP